MILVIIKVMNMIMMGMIIIIIIKIIDVQRGIVSSHGERDPL